MIQSINHHGAGVRFSAHKTPNGSKTVAAMDVPMPRVSELLSFRARASRPTGLASPAIGAPNRASMVLHNRRQFPQDASEHRTARASDTTPRQQQRATGRHGVAQGERVCPPPMESCAGRWGPSGDAAAERDPVQRIDYLALQ